MENFSNMIEDMFQLNSRQDKSEAKAIYNSFIESSTGLSNQIIDKVNFIISVVLKISETVNTFLRSIDITDSNVVVNVTSRSFYVEKENYGLFCNALNLCDRFDIYIENEEMPSDDVCIKFIINRA